MFAPAFFATAIQAGHVNLSYIANRMEELIDLIETAFEDASNEPKIVDRISLVLSNSQPLDTSNTENEIQTVQALGIHQLIDFSCNADQTKKLIGKKAVGTSDLMRKHMTSVFDEQLSKNPNMMYIGEDVEHGG